MKEISLNTGPPVLSVINMRILPVQELVSDLQGWSKNPLPTSDNKLIIRNKMHDDVREVGTNFPNFEQN